MSVVKSSSPSAAAVALLLLSAFAISSTCAFSTSPIRRRAVPLTLSSGIGGEESSSTPSTEELKSTLLKRIEALRTIKERDGDFSIDFGVKGGEIDAKSLAPQKVNYYSISPDAGRAADAVMETAEMLAKCNPTEEPTLYLGDRERGILSPLEGEWKLLFTTAADATFSKNSTRGYATAKNVVDASRGRITNVIDFASSRGGDGMVVEEPVLKQLNVVIGARVVGKSRVELRFRYVRAVLTKFFGWKKQWSLYIPVPAPLITRAIVLVSRILRFGRGAKKVVPRAYFDVLYLDDQLRIHKTGEDNIFIQAKDTWTEARPLLV